MTYIITYRYMDVKSPSRQHIIRDDKQQAEYWYNRYIANGNYFDVTKNWE